MPTRVLFAFRRLSLDAFRWLGSWRLSIVLMVTAALYYGFLAVWSISSPPPVVANIASLAPFWLVYGLLLANTGVCFWRRLPALRRQLSPAPARADRPPDWRLRLAAGDPPRALLRRRGFRTRDADGTVVGVRRRFAPLGSFLFHGAFFLLAAGFLLTLAVRQEARVWAAVGETFEGLPGQFLSRTPPRILTGPLPVPRFTILRVAPEFWRDQLLFTRLAAELELGGGERVVTRINRPLWLGWGTFLRLSGVGYAPRYQLADRHGHVLDSAFVKLDLFPPGQRDFFQVPDYPHRFYVELLPDFAVVDGEAVTASLDLKAPAVDVQGFRGRLDLGRVVLRAGDTFSFEGLRLSFPEIRYWGELTVVVDPGAPLIFTGYLVGLAGLAMKLRGGRQEVAWRPAAEGSGGVLEGWGGAPPGGLGSSGDAAAEAP